MQRLIYQGKVLKEEERDLASFGGAFAPACVEPPLVGWNESTPLMLFPFPFESS